MSSLVNIEELLDGISEIGRLAMNAASCSVVLVDGQKRQLVFKSDCREIEARGHNHGVPARREVASFVASHGEPVILNSASADACYCGEAARLGDLPTCSLIGVPLIARGKIIGVIEAVNKLDGSDFDEDDLELFKTVAADAALAIDSARLCEEVLGGYVDTIQALAAAIDAKDPYTRGHSERVTGYSLLAADALGVSEEEKETLHHAAVLHDVGKLGIDDRILRKPAPLDKNEWEVMRTHASLGAQIVDNINLLAGAKSSIRSHHERFSGGGYPDDLKGEEIPLGARIIAVADSFDTMTTDRPYRESPGVDFALSELKRCSGTQFDPEVVEAFTEAFESRHGADLQAY